MGFDTEKRMADTRIGMTVGGKFQLRECIGIGSSGSVYQADQLTLGRTVAVKVLNEELASDPVLVKRFHAEALAASRLNHPNTVSVIDYGQTKDGLLFLVMEYLAGETLTQMIAREYPIPIEHVAYLVGQVLSGLEEAHHAGVIHADLKSDNIVVEHRRNGWDQVKVVDFGISRIIGPNAPDITEEGQRSICGTPEYMAPELISGAEPTFATDLYAVGTILYELLVGHTPFVGGKTIEVLRRQLREDPVPPSTRKPDRNIPAAAEAIVMRALQKHPSGRFGSALEMRRAVESIGVDREANTDDVVCAACGATIANSFKFCSECGHPRRAVRSTVEVRISEVGSRGPNAPRATARTDYATPIEDDLAREILPFPLVGRDDQLAALVDVLAGDNDTRFVQLVGPGGSGRTRLLAEAYEHVTGRAAPTTIYQAGPDPSGLASPFYPVRAVVAAILALPPICPYDGLSAALEQLGLSRRDLPGIAELFGHEGELWQLEPPVRRRELLASTIRVMRAAANHTPAVLVFEDVDEFDHPSQELLRRLAERSDDHPLQIVVTNDEPFAERWPETVDRIDLPPLDDAALDSLAAHLAQHGPAGMPDARSLAGHSPAHVEHLVRFILEGGELHRAPTTAADLISARIGLLPHSALVVCQTAAVFGREAYLDLLRGAIGERVDAAFDEALSILASRNIVVLHDHVIAFTDKLIREVVYDATPADVRRALHSAAADELQRSISDPAILGHHRERAGHLRDAADLLMRAGDDAVHQLDDIGACALYQRALFAARQLMLVDDDTDGDSRGRFVTLSVKLADALRVGGEVGLARGIVAEARGYCDNTPALEAQLLRASAHLSMTEADADEAIHTLRRAIGLTIPTGQMDLLAELYHDLSSMYLRDGDSAAAMAELEEGIDLVTLGEGAAAQSGPTLLWRLLMRQAQLSASTGDLHTAIPTGEHALQHAKRVHSRLGSARVQSMLATLHEKAGDTTRARHYQQAAVDEMRRLGDRRGTAELLLAGKAPTRSLMRISPSSLREARELATEIGWTEGAERALPFRTNPDDADHS